MKKYRNRILVAIIICLLMVAGQFLIACDPDFDYDIEWLKEEVVSVELVKYDNEELKLVNDRAEILPIDFEKIEVVDTLEEEKIEEFIDDYYNTWKMVSGEFFAEPVGICVKMDFADGKFMLVTYKKFEDVEYKQPESMIAIFDKDGYITDMPICHFESTYGFENIIKYFKSAE